MNKKILALAGSVAALSLLAVAPVFAQEGEGMMGSPRGPIPQRSLPGVVGTVSAISGTTLTVSAKNGTGYSVDATSATVVKFPGTVSAALSDVQVGDTVLVQGAVTGATVLATQIIDGLPAAPPQMMQRGSDSGENSRERAGTSTMPLRIGIREGMMGSSTRPLPPRPAMIQNALDGKDRGVAVGGKVSTVASTSFTLEVPRMGNTATTTLTVNTTASTTYMLGRTPATFADIVAGDYVSATGVLSTSAQTMTAQRIQIATTSPMAGPGMRGQAGFNADGQGKQGPDAHMWGSASSSAPERVRSFVGSMMQSFANFFHFGR